MSQRKSFVQVSPDVELYISIKALKEGSNEGDYDGVLVGADDANVVENTLGGIVGLCILMDVEDFTVKAVTIIAVKPIMTPTLNFFCRYRGMIA